MAAAQAVPRWILLGAAFALAGCQATGATPEVLERHAVDVAARRAQLDLMCASVTPTVLGRRGLISVPQFAGEPGTEYSVAVAGCNQRSAYLVTCPTVGDACFAAPNRGEAR